MQQIGYDVQQYWVKHDYEDYKMHYWKQTEAVLILKLCLFVFLTLHSDVFQQKDCPTRL